MFRRLSSSLPKDPEFPPYLEALGYYVTQNDQIRSIANPDKEFNFFISKNDRVNEMQREAMNICIRKIVLERLEASGLDTVHVPLGTSKDEPHIPILASSEISKKKRVVVVLGEANQDLGIWAYRTIGQKGINQGSAVDFVKELQNHTATMFSPSASRSDDGSSSGVIIANLGQLVWYRGGRRAMTLITWRALPRRSAVHMSMHLDGVKNRVSGNEDSDKHVNHLFTKVLPELLGKDTKVDVIGIGDGAAEAVRFLNANWSQWSSRIDAIALGAPRHYLKELTNEAFREFLSKRGRAYLTSPEPIDTPLSGREMYGCNCYASGESYYSECVMQNIYRPVLDFFQLVAEVPGYEEVETFITPPHDGDEIEEVEEIERVEDIVEEEEIGKVEEIEI
ncbi:MAG: hypothetical protein M1830_009830 [Pleopsidium flavum]|nr:MAG: hypothetical protein M1830_009830 [Pleopsidium flavum]